MCTEIFKKRLELRRKYKEVKNQETKFLAICLYRKKMDEGELKKLSIDSSLDDGSDGFDQEIDLLDLD